jgi:hypothetical protein
MAQRTENVVEKKRKAQLHPATATLKAKQKNQGL